MAKGSDVVQLVMDRLGGTSSDGLSRPRIVRELNEVWKEIQRRGDSDLANGWPWQRVVATVPVSFTSTNPVSLTLTGVRQIIGIRNPDQTWTPIRLIQLPAREAWGSFGDMTQAGTSPSYWWYDAFDAAAQTWSLHFFPGQYASAPALSIQVMYEKAGSLLIDSDYLSEWIEIPDSYSELLALGCERNIRRSSEIRWAYEQAQLAFERAFEQLKKTAVRQDGPEYLVMDSEERYKTGQSQGSGRNNGSFTTVFLG